MNIQRVPQVTHEAAEVPLACDLHRGVEGHCKKCNGQVSEGKRDKEIVVDMSEPSVEDNTDNNKDVVDDCKEDDGYQDNTLQNQDNHIWEHFIAQRMPVKYFLLIDYFYLNPC